MSQDLLGVGFNRIVAMILETISIEVLNQFSGILPIPRLQMTPVSTTIYTWKVMKDWQKLWPVLASSDSAILSILRRPITEPLDLQYLYFSSVALVHYSFFQIGSDYENPVWWNVGILFQSTGQCFGFVLHIGGPWTTHRRNVLYSSTRVRGHPLIFHFHFHSLLFNEN